MLCLLILKPYLTASSQGIAKGCIVSMGTHSQGDPHCRGYFQIKNHVASLHSQLPSSLLLWWSIPPPRAQCHRLASLWNNLWSLPVLPFLCWGLFYKRLLVLLALSCASGLLPATRWPNPLPWTNPQLPWTPGCTSVPLSMESTIQGFILPQPTAGCMGLLCVELSFPPSVPQSKRGCAAAHWERGKHPTDIGCEAPVMKAPCVSSHHRNTEP